MCKELRYLVNTFDYERLKGSPETIHPTPDDLKVIHNLNRLDQYIARSADYNEYEELLFEVQGECFKRFDIWLSQKGIIEHHEEFTFSQMRTSLLFMVVTIKSLSQLRRLTRNRLWNL